MSEQPRSTAAAAQERLAKLTPEQRRRLQELARTQRGAPSGPLHAGFEQWAQRRPEAIAVSFGEHHVSYGELNRRADALAARLHAAGVGQGDLVAVTLDRGIELIAAILAVLKAGAAYVPVDPAVPAERQRFILQDAGARLVLTESRYRDPGAAGHAAAWLLDEEHAWSAPTGGPALPAAVGGDALAYVIYTSGSTGQPKGVMVEHRQVTRLFSVAERHFGFDEQDVWTLFHSYAFDFSVWEIWGALLYGARLVVVPHAVARTPAAFADLVLSECVTVLNQTPTAFSNLAVEMLARGSTGYLRHVVFGGEALEPRRLARWFERFGDSAPALANMYGITETTVHVTYKRLCTRDADEGISDIGAPLADLSLYVLNERGRPVPPGVTGELYVSGAGVARGYLNRPELSAERFIANPFVPGERMYKTGDLARRLPGGTLEYMGRNDHQVKLRGFRIELGDIERQLLVHPAVGDAVVSLGGEGDERHLEAHVVLSSEAGGDWKPALYRHLGATLPDYMVPAYVVALASLPMTTNGKIDRAALPVPAGSDRWQQGYEAPATRAEQILCRLVGELLHVERVGIHDNFFALGGDSLKTINLVAMAREAGLELSVAGIFAHPAIADLARTAGVREVSAMAAVGPFELLDEADRARLPDGIVAAYPMSRLQQGMVYHNLASADNSLYHNVINQRYRGKLDIERIRRALGEVMAAHEILRTSFHIEGYEEPLQMVHGEVAVPLHVTDLRGQQAQSVEAQLAAELARLRGQRLDLQAPPLFQAHVYRIADDEFELIWLEHHAILDGWSLASFMTQLTTRYAALGRGETRAPDAPRAAYRDFIAVERGALKDPAQRAFWSASMAGASATRLQAQRQCPPDNARQIPPSRLAPADFALCRAAAAALGVPLKSVLLAAYAKVVAAFSGEAELMVGLTTHGRPETPDSDDLLGLYVSTHPLRLACGAGTSWRELVRRCFDGEAAVWACRHFPMSEIKRLNGDRDLFHTSFTYNHFSVTEQAEDIGLAATRAKSAFEFNDTGVGVAIVVTDMQANQAEIHVAFDSEAVDARFARRFQDYLGLALARIGADVDAPAEVQRADDLAVLAPCMPVAEVAPDANLGARFAEVARTHAGAAALEQGGRVLSYTELDRRSALLAARLARLGVAAGDLVGFDAQPSLDMAASLLAVLRLGAVFVPLDPEQSAARLRDIVAESRLTHIVADANRWGDMLPSAVRVHVLDRLAAQAEQEQEQEREAPIAGRARCAADLAYIVYTSGSSGKPKGVMISHGNALSFREAVTRSYSLKTGARLLQMSNIGFDIFIEELLVTVFSGGVLVLRDSPRLPDADEFWQLVAALRIDVVHLATAYWNLLCGALPAEGHDGNGLSLCAVGGEAMQRANAVRWLARWGTRIRLFNSYGPTEATVAATLFDTAGLAHGIDSNAGVPIGQPLGNCVCWILGKDMRPVPRGVPGELCLGGAGIGAGYLYQDEETRQKFLEAGAAGPGSPRLYRTGDLVRLLDDGQIEYLGREDSQVKIRGFRVELDEIRHVIAQEPDVLECMVLPVHADGVQVRLAAYVVLDKSHTPDLPGIAARVREQLPGYMRPAAWVHLDAMPMTPNRKIDLRALPAPVFEQQADYVAPVDALERAVQALWETVLEREGISVEADFFAIGGHSLLLTRLLLRIGQAFEVELSMAELMRARTIREMAALLAAARSVAAAAIPAGAQDLEEMEW